MTHHTSSFAYIETSLPAGITIAEYRTARPQQMRGWRRVLRSAKSHSVSAGRGR